MAGHSLESFKSVIKSLMKQQKKSYQDLADHLGLSLVSVKRILSKEEISLSRFLEICDWLDVSLAEIEKIGAYTQTHSKLRFTEEQEKFLSKNPEYLSFLFQMYSEQTPEQIQKKYKLSAKSLNLYLIRLEKLSLVKKVAGEYKTVHKRFPSPLPYGELSYHQYKNVIDTGAAFLKRYNSLMRERKDPELDKGSNTVLAVLQLSRQSYLNWYEKYKNVYQELENIAHVEERIENIENKKVVVLMHSQAVLNDEREIEGITSMFGGIKELS